MPDGRGKRPFRVVAPSGRTYLRTAVLLAGVVLGCGVGTFFFRFACVRNKKRSSDVVRDLFVTIKVSSSGFILGNRGVFPIGACHSARDGPNRLGSLFFLSLSLFSFFWLLLSLFCFCVCTYTINALPPFPCTLLPLCLCVGNLPNQVRKFRAA